MKPKYWIVGTLVAAALLVGLAVALDSGLILKSPGGSDVVGQSQLGLGATGTGSSSSQPGTSVAGDPSGLSRTSPAESEIPAAQPTNSSSSPMSRNATATRPVWNPPTPSATNALEVPATPTPTPSKLPKSKERRPVLTALPKEGRARGQLTSSFPAKALPLPKSLTILSSSVQNQGQRVLTGVEARTSASTTALLGYYSAVFKNKGWVPVASEPDADTSMLRAAYGGDSIAVTIRNLPTGERALSVAGAFMVEK